MRTWRDRITSRLVAESPAGLVYRVKYSNQERAWYIKSAASGQCVSGLYDTEAEAEAALRSGTF